MSNLFAFWWQVVTEDSSVPLGPDTYYANSVVDENKKVLFSGTKGMFIDSFGKTMCGVVSTSDNKGCIYMHRK